MFTIEHGFDATVITLIDEPDGGGPLMADVTILGFDDRVVIEQEDEAGKVLRINLSMVQLRELRAALDLPEGNYRLLRRDHD